MHQRTFLDYVSRQDLVFVEMSALRREERLHFGDDDQKYLAQFPPELNIWMRAIMYRYSPKVLQHPNQEEHTVPIVVQVENEETGRVQQITKQFHVKVYPEALFKRLDEQGYDPDKIDLSGTNSRTAVRQAAEKELAFYNHTQDPSQPPEYITSRAKPKKGEPEAPKVIARGTFSMPTAKVEPFTLSDKWKSHWADRDDPTKSRFIRGEKEFTHSPTVHAPVELDDVDRKFLKWFDDKKLRIADEDGIPIENAEPVDGRQFKVRALMMRYNGQLLKDPQSQERYGGGAPGQIYKKIIFKDRGRKMIAEMVPVNAEHLRKKIDKLKDQGIDFELNPIEYESAKAWMTRGTFMPYKGQYGKGEQDKSIGHKKFDSIKDYIDKQYKHLANPDLPSPGIHDDNLRLASGQDFDYESPWETILDQEAQVVARRAVDIVSRQNAGSTAVQDKFPKNNDDGVNDELKTEIWTWLMKEDIVSQPQYKSQAWRIRAATAFAMQFIKDAIGKGGKNKSIDADKDIRGDSVAAKDQIGGGSGEDEEISAGTIEIITNLLQALPEADLLPDADWHELSLRYLKMCHDYMHDNKNGQGLNKTERMMIAKDLLRSEVPAMAADKAPTAKIDPVKKHAHKPELPEPEVKPGAAAISYGGYDDNDEEDDPEEIERYRRNRFR